MEDAKKLINAYFYNSERDQVLVNYIDENDKQLEYTVPVDPDHPLFQQVLQTFSMDDLHENTWVYIKEKSLAFETTVMQIAKRNGQIYDVGTANPKLYKEIARIVSLPFDPEADKELLFPTVAFNLFWLFIPALKLLVVDTDAYISDMVFLNSNYQIHHLNQLENYL